MGKEHVIIEWVKPESDGGSEIKNYIVDKREKSSTRWEQLLFSPPKIFVRFTSLLKYLCLLPGSGGHGSIRLTPSMTHV